MASIPITGIPSNYLVPGQYAEIAFGQGPSTASVGERHVYYVMPVTASGSWTANTIYEVQNEQDAIDGAGEGSPLHRALRRSLRVNKNAKYFAVPYAASSGAGVASATLDLLWAGTPSATGVARVYVCGDLCSYAFTTSDTATTIASGLKDSVNAKGHLPVTATNSSGTLTLTAKIGGASQGDGTIGQYQVHAEVDVGKGVTVDSGVESSGEIGDTVAGADGTTAEEANLATALAVLDTVDAYYIGISMPDATGIGHLVTHLTTKADPNPGLRARGFAAILHTLASAQTIATGKNYERVSIVWQLNSDDDIASVVGNTAAVTQLEESVNLAAGFDGYRKSGRWLVPAARAKADWPTSTELNDAITDGLMPIASDANGSYIVMATTTRSKNSAGTQDDFRVLEPHRISVADGYTDVIIRNDANTWANKNLQSDKLLASGEVDTNQRLPSNTVTPYNYQKWVEKEIDDFAPGHFQEVDAMKESIQCVRDPNNSGRIEVGHDIRVVDIRHQVTFRFAEVSPG